MKIQSFVFNWPGQYEKVLKTEQQLSALGPVQVINSDEEHDSVHWKNVGNDAYFTEQFMAALDLFDADVMFHIQGDATYNNYQRLFKDAKHYFTKYNWGIYAPNVDYTWYDKSRTDISSLQTDDKNIKVIGCPDCTAWFIHRDIIDDFKARKIDMSPYKMGWGWDLVLPALSYLQRRLVLRDYDHTIQHPKGTNYDKQQAEVEMAKLFDAMPPEVQYLMYNIKFDREKITNLFFPEHNNA